MRNQRIKDMVLCSLFAALMVLGAYVSIPLPGGVPITFQPFFAMLAGGVIGSKRGAVSMSLYVAMGLVGMPVFSKGASGIGMIFKPSFGYLVGFIACAYLVGFIVEKAKNMNNKNRYIGFIIAPFIGVIINYIIGVPYLYLIFNTVMETDITFKTALNYGFWPFIVLDLLKAVAVIGIISSVVPRLEKENLLA